MKFTQKIIDQKKAKGLIRGYVVTSPAKKPAVKGNKVANKDLRKGDKAKGWMGWTLFFWCKERGFKLKTEYQFASPRLWKFDFYIDGYKIGIEYEGLMSEKSGHTTVVGYTNNTDKYNEAGARGITMMRFTALNYMTMPKKLKAFEDRKKAEDKQRTA